jgi:hypothetical protein
VIDTGMGIHPESLKKLFIDFGKLDENSSMNKQGTGLGLSICKKIVEQMGGSVEVVSKVGVGTAFNINLKTKCIVKKVGVKPIPSLPKISNNLQKNYNEFSLGIKPFTLIQKNHDEEEMKSSISSMIKKNMKLKMKKSEREMFNFNNLARKNSCAATGDVDSSKNLDQNQ